MRTLLAILLPCSVFFRTGRRREGWLCIGLQISLIGWLGAAVWAAYVAGEAQFEAHLAASGDAALEQEQR